MSTYCSLNLVKLYKQELNYNNLPRATIVITPYLSEAGQVESTRSAHCGTKMND